MDNSRQTAVYRNVFIVLMILSSVVLSRLSMGLLLFPIPVLLSVNSIADKRKAVAVHLAASAAVIGVYLVTSYELFTAEYVTIGLLGLLFPLTTCIACTLWTALRDYSNSVLRKLVICSFPTAAIALAFSIWICLPAAEQSVETMSSVYSLVVPQDLLGEVTVDIVGIFIGVLKLGSVPVAMLLQTLPILISECLLHRRDEKWYFDFADMKMPYKYVWIYLILLFLSVVAPRLSFVGQIPVIIFWNLTLGLSLHFILEGVSIVVYLLRKRSLFFTPGRIMIYMAFAMVIPGLNMFVLSALLALGVFENWIKFR
ncbi:MAG: hypothetical protein K6F82_04290 [Sphaerochaetaceae bacterium]|nr:hypothetical protein [Sphaerochaetaceae bacterium]